jgi:hypothetical protein
LLLAGAMAARDSIMMLAAMRKASGKERMVAEVWRRGKSRSEMNREVECVRARAIAHFLVSARMLSYAGECVHGTTSVGACTVMSKGFCKRNAHTGCDNAKSNFRARAFAGVLLLPSESNFHARGPKSHWFVPYFWYAFSTGDIIGHLLLFSLAAIRKFSCAWLVYWCLVPPVLATRCIRVSDPTTNRAGPLNPEEGVYCSM